MKYAELIRLLKKNGCYYVDPRKGHDMMKSEKTGNTFLIPRHKSQDVKPKTLHSILKAAGVELP